MAADKEAVDAERAEGSLLEAKTIAAAMDYRHVDDKVAERDACAASVVSCMSTYISMSSYAKTKTEDALRKDLSSI